MKLLLDKLWRLILKTYILNEISLIVPCYNEQESLPVFFNEINKTMKTMGCTYELLFVDDGSSDNTLEILKAASENDPHIRYISFSRNFGKESAMYAGFCNAHGKYIAVMDADLQDPPALLPEMLRLKRRMDMTVLLQGVFQGKASLQSRVFLQDSFTN